MMGAPVPRPSREDWVRTRDLHLVMHTLTGSTWQLLPPRPPPFHKAFRLTLQLLFVLLAGCVVHTQGSPTELTSIQIPHGTECRLLVLIFTKAITFWFARLSVIHQSSQQAQKTNCNEQKGMRGRGKGFVKAGDQGHCSWANWLYTVLLYGKLP